MANLASPTTSSAHDAWVELSGGEENLVDDFRKLFINDAQPYFMSMLLIVSFLPLPKSERKPSNFLLVVVAAFCAAAFYVDFDVLPASSSGEQSKLKPYSKFGEFYSDAYVDAHVEPASRAFHVVLFYGFFAIFASDVRTFLPYMTSLLVGASMTRPFLRFDFVFLEFLVVVTTGCVIARHYGRMWKWLGLFMTWVTLDYMDHYVLGHNGKAAVYIGEHYVSWALVGQGALTTRIVLSSLGLVAA